ncbi:DUF4426 domain-containing protein [Pseudidiomarina taiwanensis]|uniref:DUF4426 domain-containing protein n=1 Tax=Pseudidiomarina taiwanensis TaxID=337250 RepID=A0A432ZM73_9GAMM|nr:DUF4426 domain-containing protein [Pseudidiomarina taiwanensis]RUO78970.1 DUF4426 domain-containing protein [Pseudidiomarina taiwanensis]
MPKLLLMLALLLGAWSNSAVAEQSTRLGPWEIHYNAFNSTFLRAEMARQYDITRSQTNAVLNIAVLAAELPGKPAQQVNVSGYVMNPLSQQQRLDFTEVVEGEAVYYITEVDFTPNERLRFFITVSDGNEQHELRFNQEFWKN